MDHKETNTEELSLHILNELDTKVELNTEGFNYKGIELNQTTILGALNSLQSKEVIIDFLIIQIIDGNLHIH